MRTCPMCKSQLPDVTREHPMSVCPCGQYVLHRVAPVSEATPTGEDKCVGCRYIGDYHMMEGGQCNSCARKYKFLDLYTPGQEVI